MRTMRQRAQASTVRRRESTPLWRGALIALLLLLAFAVPVIAEPVAPWTLLLSATFRILADAPGWPVNCTGWYAAPLQRFSSPGTRVSAYVTAGHCWTPHVVEMGGALEQTQTIARVDRAGVDAGIGARMDVRRNPTFLALATALPRHGERALVAGFSDGHLTEAVLTTLEPMRSGFLSFHSDLALRPGMSGAPIILLRTGEVVGVLIGIPHDSRGQPDPHTVIATPATSLRALMEFAVPGALDALRDLRSPASLLASPGAEPLP